VVSLSISAAASRLMTTPRALRYRESLGLLPPRSETGRHRRFGPREISALEAIAALEEEFHVGPSEVAFALRAIAEPGLGQRLTALAELTGHSRVRALAFDQEKALKLLRT
jgi:MerR family transcriptional regulator, copper efflux regulator